MTSMEKKEKLELNLLGPYQIFELVRIHTYKLSSMDGH